MFLLLSTLLTSCSIQNAAPGSSHVAPQTRTRQSSAACPRKCWPGAQVLATQQVASPPDSLLLLDSPEAGVDAGQEGAGTGSIFLHIGERRAAYS